MSLSLEKAALITAILGTILLIFLSESLEPKAVAIDKITSKDIDSYVKVSGNITYVKYYTSSSLLRIEDNTGKIYAIFYSNANITKGPATITGKVTEYRGVLEIEAEKVQTR
jgi:DNA/RNA endonuclease YhcR with UshA esterase domain